MILPGHNAHLTTVSSPGASADFDQPAGAPSQTWAGDCQAQVSERTYESTGPGGLEVITETRLIVPVNLPVALHDEDVITIAWDSPGRCDHAGPTETRRVRQVETLAIGVMRARLWNA